MATLNFFKLFLLLSLFSNSNKRVRSEHSNPGNVGIYPIPELCKRIECPTYEVYDFYNGYELRRYNSTVWISTSPVGRVPLELATTWGLDALYPYAVRLKDNDPEITFTAPMITQVNPCDGSTNVCMKTYASSYYVPKKYHANPPSSNQLVLQNWTATYVAVRRFTKPVSEFTVRTEALALYVSLAPSPWLPRVNNAEYGQSGIYSVAQYISMDDNEETVNEIWIKYPDPSTHAM